MENEDVAHRVDELRQVPAAVRFLSCKPLLGPFDGVDLAGIGWVIAGGESGAGVRSMDPAWVRQLRDACVGRGVPFFFKLYGLSGRDSLRESPMGSKENARLLSLAHVLAAQHEQDAAASPPVC